MDKSADINMDKGAEIPALLEAGDVAYIKEDLQLAAEKFSLATEYSVGVYGDFAPECFEAYFKYGKTLAAIAQDEEDDPQVQLKSVQQYLQKMTEGTAPANMDDSRIGDPDELPEEERNKIVAEVDQALEENAQKLDDFAKNAKQTSEEVKAEEEAKPEGEEVPDLKEKTPEAAAEEIKDDNDGEPDAEQENADMEEDGEEEEEDLPTIVLAYENLEVARKIAEKNEGAKEWDLKRAEVLAILGELYLKEDKFSEAIADLQTALELNQKHLDAKDRIIASSYFELALAHNLNDDYLRASELAAKAMEILSFCVEQAKTGKEDAKKVAELEECLKSVSAAHEDYTNSHKDAQMKKALEANEAAKTNVSPEKNENQEPASDITANIRKGGKRPAEDNKDIDDAAAKKSKVDEASAEQSEVPSEPVA